MPASVTLQADGTLVLTGGGGDDVLTFSRAGSRYVASVTLRDEDGNVVVTEARVFDQGVVKRLVVNGGDGNDLLSNLTDVPCTIRGGPGNDVIYGGSAADSLVGGDGTDVVFGGAGDDTLDGGPGNDQLVGGDGDDSILGGPGNDNLYGVGGDDTLKGGKGNDYLSGGPGSNTLAE